MTRLAIRDMGTALKFAGTGSGNSVVVKTTAILSGLTNMTIAGWVNMSPGATNDAVIYGERAASGNDIIKLESHGNGTPGAVVRYLYRDDAGTLNTVSGSSRVQTGWHFIAVTKSGTAVIIYFDGVVDGSGTLTATNTFTNASISCRIGSDITDGTAVPLGSIDEPRIWNVALAQAQITALYYNNVVPTTGLLGEWKFDEATGTTATDSSGNGNTGTITAAVYTSDVVMKRRMVARDYGTALSFGTATNTVSTVNSISSTDASVACWFNRTGLLASGVSRILAIGTSDVTTLTIEVGSTAGSGALPAGVYGYDSNGHNSTAKYLPVSEWHHLAASKTGTTVNVYLDGVLIKSGTGAAATVSGTVVIGAVSGEGCVGIVDDAMVWTRALSTAEVLALSLGNQPSATNLVGWWKMDEGTGTSLTDSSGNANTGTITGATFTSNVPTRSRS